MANNSPVALLRRADAGRLAGFPSRSTWYWLIKRGLIPPGVKITDRCSAWPEDEIRAINTARTGGASDDDVRRLVAELVAKRVDRPQEGR